MSDWVRRLRRPGPDFEHWLGWGDFPPLPDDAEERDFESYLEQCAFEAAVVDADNQLTVTLLDPDRQAWTFRFPDAGFSVPRWPDGTANDDWEPGIYYLATSISRSRDGLTRHSYELEGRVSITIESAPVQVSRP